MSSDETPVSPWGMEFGFAGILLTRLLLLLGANMAADQNSGPGASES